MSVEGRVERYGLIGHPVSHSFSQRYFTEKFQRENISARYELFDMPDINGLRALVAAHEGLRGLNVTIPHKQAVMPLLDELAPTARSVGAVNTVHVKVNTLIGHNTDAEGFRQMLLPLLGTERPRALVLGTGGASRAVAYVLKDLNIKFRLVSRTRDRGDITFDMVDATVMKVSPLIINTTPLGQHPLADEAPQLPYDQLTPRHMLIDLVYNPEVTAFMRNGRTHGARTCNGLPMLHAQAEAAWRVWNN